MIHLELEDINSIGSFHDDIGSAIDELSVYGRVSRYQVFGRADAVVNEVRLLRKSEGESPVIFLKAV